MKASNYKNINDLNLKKILLTLSYRLFFFTALFLQGCAQKNTKQISEICKNVQVNCEKNKVNILLLTNKGKVNIELDGSIAPVTVGHFVELVERGFYDKTRFNRVINTPISFIVQGGESVYRNSKTLESQYIQDSFVNPETGKVRYIPLEIKLKFEEYPRYNKIIKKTNNLLNIELKHKRGSISMARSEALNSASSQFYISLQSLPELDGRYAVFGSVIKGMKVFDSIKKNDYIIRAEKL